MLSLPDSLQPVQPGGLVSAVPEPGVTTGPAEVVHFFQVFGQVGSSVVALVTQVTHIQLLGPGVFLYKVHLHGALGPALEVTFRLRALQLNLSIVHFDVTFHISRSLAFVVAQVARVWFFIDMLVPKFLFYNESIYFASDLMWLLSEEGDGHVISQ